MDKRPTQKGPGWELNPGPSWCEVTVHHATLTEQNNYFNKLDGWCLKIALH